MKTRFLAVARRELRDTVAYYERQRAGLGREFRDDVAATLERIQALPEAYHPLGANIRRSRLSRFPYGIIYQPRDREILVVAVAHLHRDPDHWRDRI